MQSCDCAESSRTNTGGSRCQDCHPRRAPAPLVAAGVSAAISVRCALFTSPSCGPRCEEEGSIFIARHSWNWKRGKEHEDENKEIEGEVMRFLPLSLSIYLFRLQADRPLWKKLSKEEPRALNSWGHWSIYIYMGFLGLERANYRSLPFLVFVIYLGPRHSVWKVESAGCGVLRLY